MTLRESRLTGSALLALAASLGSMTVVFGLASADHMAQSVDLCGPQTGHCLSCAIAGSSLLAAAVALAGATCAFMPGRIGAIAGRRA